MKQLMALNGQGVFTLLAAIGGLVFGGFSIKEKAIEFCKIEGPFYIIIVGFVLLFIAAGIFSLTYNRRIKKLEALVSQPQEIDELGQTDIFEIRPHPVGSYLLFFGLLLLVIGALTLIGTFLMKT
ncbi:MAG: hypothetical protein HRT65_10830 [Flavobacteriaceae bacterium]|nr:hypothetical protein [Flavobacteriaceae bacterium]